MNATLSPNAAAIAAMHARLSELDWITEGGQLTRLSRDFSWFSPVLKRRLAGKTAEAVVRPRTEDEVRAVVGACAAARVPLTIRGSGTGNYGQTTPLHGGVVLDMTGFDALEWVRPGAARAQAGLRLGDLEAAARQQGQELRCMPSTYRSATLGGLFGGGFGGIGSINYGPLAAPGNILGVRAMTIEPEPRVIELRGAEAVLMHHLWGTNGLVLSLELALAPAQPWLETLTTFSSFAAALAFADALANAPGIAKREVAFLASPVPDHLRALAGFLPPGCHAVLAVVASSADAALSELADHHGGTVTCRQDEEALRAGARTLLEFTWNHTTLHALKVDPSLTYIQTVFAPGEYAAKIAEMADLFGGEVLMHVEFIRTMQGQVQCSGLQLVRFSSEARLEEIMAIHRARGVRVNNPHTHIIEDGKAGGPLPEPVLAMKTRFDPNNLLNPGKLRAAPAPGLAA